METILLCLLCPAAAADLAWRRIPNPLVLGGLLLALLLHGVLSGPMAVLSRGLAGAAVGLLLFLPFYAGGGMAGGDVKLAAMAASFFGPWLAWQFVLASAMAGGLLALGALLLARWRGRAPQALPYALAILGGALATVAFAHR